MSTKLMLSTFCASVSDPTLKRSASYDVTAQTVDAPGGPKQTP